ncbi:MAG: hypothetical protein ABFD54_04995 [Armatimonadota bacterium]|nr:hypothetical protein [bacterium]
MTPSRIPNQIDNLGSRRLFGCIVQFALAVLFTFAAVGLVAGRAGDKHLRALVVLAFSGFVMGLGTSILTSSMRRLLKIIFIVAGLAMSTVMFALRTMFGYADSLPLVWAASPLALSLAFLLGQCRRDY